MKKYTKPLLLLLAAAAIFLADRHFGWSRQLTDGNALDLLMGAVRENLWQAAFLYCLLTVVGCVLLALPGVTFAVFAGMLFGPWLGTLLCLVATTMGAVLAFLAGRFFLRDAVKPMVMKNRWLRQLLFEGTGRKDVLVLAITRLVPLFPYNLQNFAYGITDIPLSTYTLCTFLFMAPGVAMFTLGTAGLTAEGNTALYLTGAAVLLVLVLGIGWYMKRKYLHQEA